MRGEGRRAGQHLAVSKAAHTLAPELVIWECDTIVYQAGWLQQGIVGPAQLGTGGYLYETPEKRILTEVLDAACGRAGSPRRSSTRAETGFDQIGGDVGGVVHAAIRGDPDYFTHWGEAFRYAASVIGLPVGDYPHSRPPQGILPEDAKAQIRKAFENVGFARQPASL